MKLFIIAIVVIIAVSCNESSSNEAKQNKFDIAAVKAHIDEANKVYGDRFKSNDTSFYVEKYCKDAIIMPEQMSQISGRDGIRNFNYNEGKNKDFIIAVTATAVYGDTGAVIEEGYYTFPGVDGVVYDKGKFIAIWKQEDGKWKLFREIWNTDNPPATTK